MRFWQIKHAENPKDCEKDAYNESKDSYDRDDNYNVHGLFTFFALRIRHPFLKLPGIATDKIELLNTEKPSQLFIAPMSPYYNYEIMLPLIVNNL